MKESDVEEAMNAIIAKQWHIFCQEEQAFERLMKEAKDKEDKRCSR